MSKYTLDTDFSALSGQKANNWILKFRGIAETAFKNSDNRSRLLGNLLVIERYVHTLQQGLSVTGNRPTTVLINALNLLWNYAEGAVTAIDFQDFANNIYASTLAYHSDEELSDTQELFYEQNFGNTKLTRVEWEIITWVSALLMELVAIVVEISLQSKLLLLWGASLKNGPRKLRWKESAGLLVKPN